MLRVSLSFLVMGIVMFYVGMGVEFMAYAVILVWHEFWHAEIAQRLGYQLDYIKLSPYGASLTGQFSYIKPRDEIMIAIAGPLSNLALAIVIAAIWWFWPASYVVSESLLVANLAILFFNLLPIYPLDGGRILLATLSKKYRRQKAYTVLRAVGWVVCLVLLTLSICGIIYNYNFNLLIVAIFVLLSTLLPEKLSTYQRLFAIGFRSKRIKNGLPIRDIAVDRTTTVRQAFGMLNSSYYNRFVIIDKGKIVSTITEQELEHIATNNEYDEALCIDENL